MKIPLLRDRHTHPFLYASWMDGLNIHQLASRSDALAAIEACDVAEGETLIVQGWLDSKYQILKEELRNDLPIVVFNLSLHGLVMNSTAKALIEQQLGEEGRWTDQIWIERNLRRILNGFALLNGNASRLKRYFDWLQTEHSVIYAEEMLLAGQSEIDAFQEANLLDRTRFWCSLEMWNTLPGESRPLIYGMKIFADGALGVRTAAVNEPYDNGDRGMLMYSDSELEQLVSDCMSTGKAVAIHAIGDRAIDQVVACVQKLRGRSGFNNEVRIEHAQLISLKTARLAKEHGITLSMQPNFSIDSKEYADRLSAKYVQGNNPFRMLIDEVGFVPGEDLILGSDGMPPGMDAATEHSFHPPFPELQQLTPDEFIAGYCDNSVFEHAGEVDVNVSLSTNSR